MEQAAVTFLEDSGLKDSTLVVTWEQDSGRIGQGVSDYLLKQLGCRPTVEMDPALYFPLNGVSIEGDVARLPQSVFYSCRAKNLALFKSDVPAWEWNEYINTVLDVAQQHCHAKQILTVGGIVSFAAHTAPRHIIAVANSPEMTRKLSGYNLAGLDHETEMGQRPTMSSYLLWTANKRNIPAASIWSAVPFYLADEDPAAWEKVIHFLNDAVGAGVDLSDLGQRVAAVNQRVAEVTGRNPELDGFVHKLESGVALTQEESEKLAREIEEALRRRL